MSIDAASTSSNDPDQIRREIEATRSDLSDNVNALADSVKPGNVARRQVDKVKSGAADLKDKVMGATDDSDDVASSGGGAAGHAMDSVKDAAQQAPTALRRRARGNPLAAGLVAFGLGWLVSSLIPSTTVEQQAATALKDTAAPLTDQVTDAAKDLAGNLKEPLQHAAAEVKSTATDAAATVKDQATDHAQNLSGSAADAANEVKQHAGS